MSDAGLRLEHAIYGSENGLGDYRLLGSSPGIDAATATSLTRYASLGGSALRVTFPPIYSFFAVGTGRWAFTCTVCLRATSRGNDYLVHAVLLDAPALLALRYSVFLIADAGLFTATKPASDTVLPPLVMPASRVGAAPASTITRGQTAFCLRALAAGPVRLHLERDADGAAACRAIHDALPPLDRVATTFCSRFSYERRLDFQFAGFVPADETLVREHAVGGSVIQLPAASAPPAGDLFDMWLERGDAGQNLFGLRVLPSPEGAGRLLGAVAHLAVYEITDENSAADVARLRDAAQLVLRRENHHVITDMATVRGALLVQLFSRVGDVLEKPAGIDELANGCIQLKPESRAEVLRRLHPGTLEGWIEEMLLRLPDAELPLIERTLTRRSREDSFLAVLRAQKPAACKLFLTRVLATLRDKFGAVGAAAAARLAGTFASDLPLMREIVTGMEGTATAVTPPDKDWLLAIAVDAVRLAGLAPLVSARIVLTYDLLDRLDDQQIEDIAPALLAMEQQLVAALTAAADRGVPAALLFGWLRRSGEMSTLTPAGVQILDMSLRAATRALATRRSATLTAGVIGTLYMAVYRCADRDRMTLAPTIAEACGAVLGGELTDIERYVLLKLPRRLGVPLLQPATPRDLVDTTVRAVRRVRRRSPLTALATGLRGAAQLRMMGGQG